ncbi:MAG: restriction endonuclease [Betaproteobacteria bacterium]|nr:restriction endonuclease [Betaproteobacteria bacterium]
MKLQMNRNSIFAVLMRSPWWISGGLSVLLFTSARLLLPTEYAPYAFFFALPFALISLHTGWRQLRAPSEASIAQALQALRAMSWAEFSAAVEAYFSNQGYGVERISVPGADLRLSKGGRTSLVACKRWKAARTGLEPLRELDAARRSGEAHEGIYIAIGELSEGAAAFVAANKVRLLAPEELAKLARATRA